MGTLQVFDALPSIKHVDRCIQRDYMSSPKFKVLWKSIKFGAFTYLVEINKPDTKPFAVFFIFKIGFSKDKWYSVKEFDENAGPYYGTASLKALKIAESYGYAGLHKYGAHWRLGEYARYKKGVVPEGIKKLCYKSAYRSSTECRVEILSAHYTLEGDLVYRINDGEEFTEVPEKELCCFSEKELGQVWKDLQKEAL